MKVFNFIILFILLITVKCSKPDGNNLENAFKGLNGTVLGYDFVGQEEKWGKQDNLFNVYSDAMIFKPDNKLEMGAVLYAYKTSEEARKNLYYNTIDSAYGSWIMDKNMIRLEITPLPDTVIIRNWRILDISDQYVTIEQLRNNEIFDLTIEDSLEISELHSDETSSF